MRKPTPQQIRAEMKKLNDMRPHIPRYSMFGEDNWDKINAEVDVLAGPLTDDDIWERWPEEEDEPIRSCAQDAMRWMSGESKESPSNGWEPLVKKS